uniref:USP domain-containing protein n=1 Tax=Meloidogyne incognita TaxID=6306 RepID=A0A914L1J5_MELIC
MMLDDFSEFEYIQQSWECPKCSKTSRSIEIGLDQEPDILVFHINRFDQSEKCTKKNVTNVATPLKLTELCWFCDKRRYKKYYKYDLSCVIFHHGNKSSSGNYTAATRNFIDGKWRLFDDTEVKVLNRKSQIKEIFESPNSYMLFYQRERSKDEYRRRENHWFPRDVPYEIIEKYKYGRNF